MYVMSSLPPNQQSLAGGIFNTITKICSAIGLGISASIYNAESTGKAALQTTIKPYQSLFWFCVAVAGVSLCFVPFLTIGKQGHVSKTTSVADFADEKETGKGIEGGKNSENLVVQDNQASAKEE
jgi:hypothetical protein